MLIRCIINNSVRCIAEVQSTVLLPERNGRLMNQVHVMHGKNFIHSVVVWIQVNLTLEVDNGLYALE
jgi:hypothetical protein